MNLLSYILNHRILLHVLYWIGVFVFFCLYGLGHNQPLKVSFFVISVDFPVQILASYSFVYYQLPLLMKKKYFSFTIATILLAYIFYLLVHFNHDYGIGTNLISWHTQHEIWEIFAGADVLFRNLVDIYIVVFVTGAIKFVKAHMDSRHSIEQLQIELAQVNYNTLKSQMNTEFVLSTLQLIIDQSKMKSTHTSDTIAQLSSILDDTLYQSKSEFRPLLKEVEQVKAYLEISGRIIPTLEIRSFDYSNISGTLPIKSRILIQLCELIIDQLATIQDGKTLIDIVLLQENGYCILQFSRNQKQKMFFNSVAVNEFLKKQYSKEYDVNNDFEGMEWTLTIKLKL